MKAYDTAGMQAAAWQSVTQHNTLHLPTLVIRAITGSSRDRDDLQWGWLAEMLSSISHHALACSLSLAVL